MGPIWDPTSMLYPQKQNKKSMLLGCYAGQDAVHETHFGTKCCAKHGLLPDPPKWIHHMLTCKWHQHAGAFICTCSQQTSMLRLQLDAAASTCQDSSLSQDPEQQLDNPGTPTQHSPNVGACSCATTQKQRGVYNRRAYGMQRAPKRKCQIKHVSHRFWSHTPKSSISHKRGVHTHSL